MDALPPDPYLALGVAKDATTAAIKTQYRKLVLKCHPDKVEESQKQDASDKFHKIQTAYEIIGDEERRSRYDAQCKLAELRKEAMERGGARGGVEVRTASYKMPTETSRGDFYARGPERYSRASPTYDTHYEPQYEERRPSYAQEDYFDREPRTASRKYDDYDRPSKRSPPKEERAKTKVSSRSAKENDRSNKKEKSRREEKEMREKEVRRDRDRKNASATVEEVDSDESEKRAKKARAERQENQRREEILREQQREQEELLAAREKYHEQVRKEKEAADSGAYTDERATKMFRDSSHAYDYINRTRNTTEREPERRPSPVRAYSSKDRMESVKRDSRPTVSSRRGSERTTRQESRRSTREREEVIVEPQERSRRSDARDGRRAPTLPHTNSAPPEVIRPGYERQRSYTVEEDYFQQAPPQIKRSETMPTTPAAAAPSRGRKAGSKLRPEESYATPELTPEPEIKAPRYRYGQGQSYADDGERCTPDGYVLDGYRTEVREPTGKRLTRSPSPIADDRSRDRQRSSSKKTTAPAEQAPSLPRTTSYKYSYPSKDDAYTTRPPVSREDSGRREDPRLFGEVRTSSSPRQTSYAYSPPPEKISRGYTPDKFQTGHSRRSEKPSMGRSASARVY